MCSSTLKKKAYYISGRYNEIEEEVRLDKVFVLGSCPLPSYSMDFPLVVPGSTAWLHVIDRLLVCTRLISAFSTIDFAHFWPSHFLDALFSKCEARS